MPKTYSLPPPIHNTSESERLTERSVVATGFVLREEDLLPLSLGAAFLGTGGGGNPHIGMLRARELVRKGKPIQVLPLDALPDEAYIAAVGGIGASVVSAEKIRQGEECLRALRAVEDAAGIKVAALISFEIGGANAMEPVLTAAQAGLPVIDGDGMGRAFPEVQMTSYFIYGQSPSPGAIADDKGNVVVFKNVVDMYWLERFARQAAINMGASGGFASAPMTAAFVRRSAVPGTVTQALEIGHTILDARARHLDVVGRLLATTGATLLFTGKITDVRRELKGGFARGHVDLAGFGDHQGSAGRIAIQNENLVLWVDGEPVAVVPDLIMNVEIDTGQPITTEVLRYGQRVAVIGLPAHPLMNTDEALKVVGPAAFGYPEIPYRPLKIRATARA